MEEVKATAKQENQLITTIQDSGVEASTGKFLEEQFLPMFKEAEKWKKKALSLVVTDASQVKDMATAREARLDLKRIRVNADKKRIALKQNSLRERKAIQGVYNVIDYLITPIEVHLYKQEKFVELIEAERLAELKAKRLLELEPYWNFVPLGIDLRNMKEEDYQKIFKGAKMQRQAELDKEALEEQKRFADQKAKEVEQERIRLENIQLRKDAEAKEKEREKERLEEKKIADQKLAEEQKAWKEFEKKQKIADEKAAKAREEASKKLAEETRLREQLENGKREAQEAIDKEIKRKADFKRSEELLPDKKKIIAFVELIETTPTPVLKNKDAQDMVSKTKLKLIVVVNKLLQYATSL